MKKMVVKNLAEVCKEIEGLTLSEVMSLPLDWQYCYPVVDRETKIVKGVITQDNDSIFKIEDSDIVYEDSIEPLYRIAYYNAYNAPEDDDDSFDEDLERNIAIYDEDHQEE